MQSRLRLGMGTTMRGMMLKPMLWLARVMAILGGVMLIALIALTCLSIIGRGGNSFGHSELLTSLAPGLAKALIASGVAPVQGDFELVEAGIAFAIFAFLPFCQLHSGHATVDVFTSLLPRRANAVLAAFWEVLLAAVIVLICLRLYVGMQDKMRYGEITYLLQFPIWWAYALSLVAAIGAAIVAVYCACARVLTLITGRTYLPQTDGASH